MWFSIRHKGPQYKGRPSGRRWALLNPAHESRTLYHKVLGDPLVGFVPRWVFGVDTDLPLPLLFGALGFIAGVTGER